MKSTPRETTAETIARINGRAAEELANSGAELLLTELGCQGTPGSGTAAYTATFYYADGTRRVVLPTKTN
jgi:hypothetical protein